MQRSHQRHTTKFDASALTVEVAHRLEDHPEAKKTIKKIQKRKQRQHNKDLCVGGQESE